MLRPFAGSSKARLPHAWLLDRDFHPLMGCPEYAAGTGLGNAPSPKRYGGHHTTWVAPSLSEIHLAAALSFYHLHWGFFCISEEKE